MGICPDCGGWVDEGDCSCSCGSTRYIDDYYDDSGYCEDYSSSYENFEIPDQFLKRLKQQSKEANERKKREEEEKKRKEEFERKRREAEIRFELRQYEAQKKREREENEKNPEYLAKQIQKVKNQVIASRLLFITGPDHLGGLQKKADNAFGEVIRLQDKLAEFDIEQSDDYECLEKEIKILKKENRDMNYIIDHIDEAYCTNVRTVLQRNMERLEYLEEKFDSLYPKRGILNRRDKSRRTKINID